MFSNAQIKLLWWENKNICQFSTDQSKTIKQKWKPNRIKYSKMKSKRRAHFKFLLKTTWVLWNTHIHIIPNSNNKHKNKIVYLFFVLQKGHIYSSFFFYYFYMSLVFPSFFVLFVVIVLLTVRSFIQSLSFIQNSHRVWNEKIKEN